jgi:Asp/Glu/hydantoin racemase
MSIPFGQTGVKGRQHIAARQQAEQHTNKKAAAFIVLGCNAHSPVCSELFNGQL